MEIPKFLKKEGDALVYNQEGELVYYVPEEFFGLNIAEIAGSYVSLIGVFDYAIISSTGKVGEAKTFRLPTVFLCKPYDIEKAKNLKVGKSKDSKDYRILHFGKGDEVISQCRVPQIIDNVEDFFRLMVITGRIPTTIGYDEGQDYFIENMNMNGESYNLNLQLFGILWAELCRDPNDITRLFCETNMNDMHGYKPASIKVGPNYVSPYVALTSENFDESLRAAVILDDKAKDSPLEKILTQ